MIRIHPIAFLGWAEILLIAGVIVLLFGATRLPQIGRGLGEGIREFKRSLAGEDDEDRPRLDADDRDSRDSHEGR